MLKSGKNKKVLKNIKDSDLTTPLTKLKRDREQQALIKESLKKSGKYKTNGLKSFGSAIKKLITTDSAKNHLIRSRENCSKRSPYKRNSISSSALIPKFEITPTPPQTIHEELKKTSSPLMVDIIKSSNNNNASVVSISSRRRSISVNGSCEIESQSTVQQSAPAKNLEVAEREKQQFSLARLPPPLPPKPSPATIIRKCSAFSLQEQSTKSDVVKSSKTVSTKSLPSEQSFTKLSFEFKVKPLSSPLADLSNLKKVKLLRAKYESLSQADTKIPRAIASKCFNYNKMLYDQLDNYENADENYVCLNSISKVNLSPSKDTVYPKKKANSASQSRSKQFSCPQLPKQNHKSSIH